MITTEEILCRIEKGGTLDELATELGMRKSILVERIEFMARAGYLCEIHSRKGQGCVGGGALSKNIVIYHRGERRVRRVLRLFNQYLDFLVPLRSPCALR